MAKRLTQGDVAKTIKSYGMTFRKTDWDEYRVAFPNDEDSAYYTDDLQDALDTGLAMYSARLRGKLGTATPHAAGMPA